MTHNNTWVFEVSQLKNGFFFSTISLVKTGFLMQLHKLRAGFFFSIFQVKGGFSEVSEVKNGCLL